MVTSLPTRLYYRFKPFLPRALRLAIRRAQARRILGKSADVWPIKESAGRQPEGWQGWSQGKQHAFVLTHDVESQSGLDRVRRLAELEMELGFRSSFNFIPEGDYAVPKELREWLTEKGFEVGVHDLHHDGGLYSSRKDFRRKAQKINRYLEKWNSVGFRSGFMMRRLDWIHDLNILYDSSIFDTDPFEPQPEGLDTIFPCWISGREQEEEGLEVEGRGSVVASTFPKSDSVKEGLTSGAGTGYVELPYTLPQDSTVFLLLGERDCSVWQKKHAWVAEKGGMALLNVHPDYMAFEGEPNLKHEFPAARYRNFLEYVQTHFAGQCWHALPCEVARFFIAWRESLAAGAPISATAPSKSGVRH